MAADQAGGEATWRAAALDVRGPGSHGRGRRGDVPAATTVYATGDRGELWIEAGALYFSGEHDAWSVPLSWLGAPETGLAGATEIAMRSGDRGRSITLRLARAADERPLADAILHSRSEDPDPRDRRALQDLLALLQPELRRLDAAADGPMTPQNATQQGQRMFAVAARLRSTWLPYWGNAATRLRDSALGALVAAAEAVLPGADEAAAERHEQASRRFRNVCEDLHDWCGLPESLDALPAPRLAQANGGPAVPLAAPAAFEQPRPAPVIAKEHEATPVPAWQPSVQHASPEPEPTSGQMPPAASLPPTPVISMPAAASPAPVAAPAAAMRAEPATAGSFAAPQAAQDEDGDMTVIAPPRGPSLQPGVQPAPAASVVPTPPPPDEDATVVVNSTPPYGAETASPVSIGRTAVMPAASAPPAPGTIPATSAPPPPVVTGPGRRGSGGMTMLYRRSGAGPSGTVARKELQPDGVATPDATETFLRIGRRFGAVQHPNFVRIMETGGTGGTGGASGAAGSAGAVTPFIDMEFVEGEGITPRLRRGPLPPEQALDVIDHLAGAIDAVHQAGLVHGDVRPLNVLMEQGGRTVLLEPSVAADYVLEQRRGTIYGELSYLTPERVAGEPAQARGDIYALGTLAFALFTGHPPFEGEAESIFASHSNGTPPLLDSVIAAPPAAAAAIARALAKRPAERQATAAELATALRRAFSGQPQAQPPPLPWAPAPQAAPPAAAHEREAPPAERPWPPSGPPARPGTDQGTGDAIPPGRQAPGPLGRGAPSPLGRSAPSPLGRPAPSSPPPVPGTGNDDDDDRTIIVGR